MNSKILKLDAPYNIIYAGGRVGRHIATMTVWEDNDMGIYDARQYAMIDEGGELAAGACRNDDWRTKTCETVKLTGHCGAADN